MDLILVLHSSALLLLLYPFPSHVAVAASLNIVLDKEALLSLKFNFADPSGELSSWNDSNTICEWSGVSCSKLHDRVSGLNLQGLGLKGAISPHIGNLSFLRFLYLEGNYFSGTLPDQIGELFRLNVLNISSNLIQGPIPLSISNCQELQTLDLSSNLFSGAIPREFELLKKLHTMKLGQNRLTGMIPSSIGNISSLATLDLGTNLLKGSIPSELGRLRNLQHLQLSINNLTGFVPASLYNLSTLVTFALASNNLRGEIPGDVGFKLPNLLLFHFCWNEFIGPMPPSLHNVTKIQSLRMSHNFLTGSVPPGLEKLSDLNMYNIGFNRFVSKGTNGLQLVTSLTNSSKLEFLAIDGNLLEGVIPESVGNLSTKLSKFYIGQNHIFGSIPQSIGRLTSLTLLSMSQNKISGDIPSSISRLNKLQMLGLAANKIQGVIPATLGNLTVLTKVELFGNDLAGSLPSIFGSFQHLLYLDLSSNKLNGSIPMELFSITSLTSLLNLSRNHLSGPLPQQVERLENVAAIDLSNNLLSGNIPESIEKCRSLQSLSLSSNSLSGHIPKTIANLKGLQSLDLSSNQLSGSIPDKLGEMQALQSLNLSFNDLEGVVPKEGVFRNLSAVHLEGNRKLCWPSSPSCDEARPWFTGRRTLKRDHIAIIAAASLAFFCILLAMFWFLITKTRGIHARASAALSASFKGKHPLISYDELLRATENFGLSNLIGTGSFGSVYRGILRDGMAVAVKVLNLRTHGASKSFITECEALRNAKHRNLVKLVTCCSSLDFENTDFLALVYEFMGGGSLEDWIRGRKRHVDGSALSLMERLDIAIDVASAIVYLHNDRGAPIVHRDLKPSNVLLDDDMMAKVGDFGLARLLLEKPADQESVTSTNGIKGSIGYIPPEYGFGARPSTEGDVYSYGVMLLELLAGKSPTDEIFAGDLSLEKWVRAAFPNRIMEIGDPELIMMMTHEICYEEKVVSPEKQQGCVLSMVKIGLDCATDLPEARITMNSVIHQLKGIKHKLNKPQLEFEL